MHGRYIEVPTFEVRGYLIQHLNLSYCHLASGITSNVLNHLKAHSLLHSDAEPPCWIEDPSVDWPAGDILMARHGLVSMPKLLRREPVSIEKLTPRFFTLNALDYDVDQNAGAPNRWLDFLQ